MRAWLHAGAVAMPLFFLPWHTVAHFRTKPLENKGFFGKSARLRIWCLKRGGSNPPARIKWRKPLKYRRLRRFLLPFKMPRNIAKYSEMLAQNGTIYPRLAQFGTVFK